MAAGDEELDGAAVVAVLDEQAIRSLGDLVGDDPGAVAELVEAFLEEAPTRLGELRTGVARADPTLVGRAAHTLKSNAFTFGAATLGELCQELEGRARDGRLDGAAGLVVYIEDDWARVRPALEQLRSGAPS